MIMHDGEHLTPGGAVDPRELGLDASRLGALLCTLSALLWRLRIQGQKSVTCVIYQFGIMIVDICPWEVRWSRTGLLLDAST